MKVLITCHDAKMLFVTCVLPFRTYNLPISFSPLLKLFKKIKSQIYYIITRECRFKTLEKIEISDFP